MSFGQVNTALAVKRHVPLVSVLLFRLFSTPHHSPAFQKSSDAKNGHQIRLESAFGIGQPGERLKILA